MLHESGDSRRESEDDLETCTASLLDRCSNFDPSSLRAYGVDKDAFCGLCSLRLSSSQSSNRSIPARQNVAYLHPPPDRKLACRQMRHETRRNGHSVRKTLWSLQKSGRRLNKDYFETHCSSCYKLEHNSRSPMRLYV